MSLDFFLQVAAQNRTKAESPTEWGKYIREQLQPTTVILNNYGGAALEIVSQVDGHLSRGDYSVDAQLYVQKEGPS